MAGVRVVCLAGVRGVAAVPRMWEVCQVTALGGSSAVTGQEITLEVMEKKPAMLEALSPRSAAEARRADDGSVPGDGLGAAGLDSSIFAHLKRNWTWNTAEGGRRGAALAPAFLPGVTSITTAAGTAAVTVSTRPNVKRSTRGQKRKRASSPAVRREAEAGSRPAVVRRVVRRKAAVERRPYYDEKDKAALRLMRKLRVDWSPREDSFLLLCKVAGAYLCAASRHQMVHYTVVRDLLHTHFPESNNKTSRACQRRLNYMLRNRQSAEDVALFLEDARQDGEVAAAFPAVPRELAKAEQEARVERDFGPLVELLVARNARSSRAAPALRLPPTLAEVEAAYHLVFPAASDRALEAGRAFAEPAAAAEVQAAVINALVTSSLCSASDKKSWAFQMFKIYQQYPDSLLRQVMFALKENKMISLKKHYNKAKVKEGNYLPLSSTPYQLSVTFTHTFLCRYQYDIYSAAWEQVRALLAAPGVLQELAVGQEGGRAAAVVELMAEGRVDFRTEVPEQLVVLDPTMAARDENYVRILQRYRELLRNAGTAEGEVEEAARRAHPTTTALFTKRNKDEEEGDVVKEQEQEKEEEQDSTLDSALDSTLEEEEGGRRSTVVFQGGGDADQRSTATVAKTASRIALYMMREEMKESPADSAPVQHSHDFFVISSCAVLARLRGVGEGAERADGEEEQVTYHGVTVPRWLLPADLSAVEAVLARFALGADGRSTRATQRWGGRRAVVPAEEAPWELVRAACLEEGWGEVDIANLANLCSFIEGFQVLGASKAEVRGWKGGEGVKVLRVEELLAMAVRQFLVLQVGVVQHRWVAHRHGRPWLLHSYKVLRPSEELGSLKESGKLYQGHGPLHGRQEEQGQEEEQGKEHEKRTRR